MLSAGNRVRLFFKIFMTGSGTCVVIVVKAASFLFISEKKFNFSNDVLIADADLNFFIRPIYFFFRVRTAANIFVCILHISVWN